MGLKFSRSVAPDDPVAPAPPASAVLRDFDVSAPTAAVIGAGLAGVHAAYELAGLGFRVTVFDRRGAVAAGETRRAVPFVGVGAVHPHVHGARLARPLLRGALFPFLPAPPDAAVAAADGTWRTCCAAAVHRWLWARRWGTLSGDEVMRITGNMARLSRRVVEELAARHESLDAHILRRGVAVGVRQADGEVAPLETADASPMMIDPVGWTSELAKISREAFGVQFALGERLVDYETCLRYDTEFASTLRFARNEDDRVVYTQKRFDVVVLAAGAETGPLTWASSQMPIIGLCGSGVAIHEGTKDQNNEAPERANALLPLQKALPLPFDLIALDPCSHLLAYRMGDTTLLQGPLSFDTTNPSATAAGATAILRRVETLLRARCGIDVPLVREEHQQAHNGRGERVTAAPYVCACTPDGLPIVSHNGAAFNSFVCAGFGDHAPDLAPAAAKVLAKTIELNAHAMQRDAAEVDALRTVSVGRVEKAWDELQLLLNGYVSISPEKRGEVALETFARNPLAASRFGGVVKDVVRDASHISPVRRVVDWETKLLQKTEPINHLMNRYAVRLARHDNIPDWLRTIVYYYFSDVEDDEEYQRAQSLYADGLRRISAQYEGKTVPPS